AVRSLLEQERAVGLADAHGPGIGRELDDDLADAGDPMGRGADRLWRRRGEEVGVEPGHLHGGGSYNGRRRRRTPGGGVSDAAVATHDTFDGVLERRDLDAVLVFSDNRTSAELGVRALGHRLPVMLEKPMAADLAGARALLAAARTAGVPLMVNWPTAWRPALRHGLTLALEGAVGAPVQLSHRGGHAGPRE